MAYSDESMAKAAKLYYYEQKSQNEIAGILSVSRVCVSRMLRAAMDKGIVRVYVKDTDNSLEHYLADKYSLQTVVLAKHNIRNPMQKGVSIAKVSSKFFAKTIMDGDVVGLGWGSSVTGMIMQMNNARNGRDRSRALIVPIIGGMNERSEIYNVNELVRMASEKLGGRHHKLYAPAVVDSMETKNALLCDSTVNEVCRHWSCMNVLVLGIGALRPPFPAAMSGYLAHTPIDYERLDIKSDLCFNYFSSEGEYIPTKINENVIGVNYEQMKATPLVIAIAYGDEKVPAIAATLKNGFVNVFITDEETAISLRDYDEMGL